MDEHGVPIWMSMDTESLIWGERGGLKMGEHGVLNK